MLLHTVLTQRQYGQLFEHSSCQREGHETYPTIVQSPQFQHQRPILCWSMSFIGIFANLEGSRVRHHVFEIVFELISYGNQELGDITACQFWMRAFSCLVVQHEARRHPFHSWSLVWCDGLGLSANRTLSTLACTGARTVRLNASKNISDLKWLRSEGVKTWSEETTTHLAPPAVMALF